MLGEVSVGQIGERSLLAWTDGPFAKIVALDARGEVAGTAVGLNEPRTNAQGLIVLASAGRAFVLYTHKFGANLAGCDLVARTVDASGVPGGPVVLARDVCSITESRYQGAVREATLLTANVTDYEGVGVRIARWSPGSSPQTLGELDDDQMTSIAAVEATGDGWVVAWSHEADTGHPCAGGRCAPELAWTAHRLDEEGRPTGSEEALRVGRYGRPVFSGDRFLVLRLRAGTLELHELPVSARDWKTVDAGAPVTDGRLDRAGGRLWAAVEVTGGGHRVVPLAPDGTAAGPPWEIAGDLFAIDGSHGVAVTTHGRQISAQPLDCSPGLGGRRPVR